ncbi:MAG: UbiD family decarboxylase [Clostridia bacterium]|nr:UbiD family decarboxylase [Clostridia bacterium]
MTPEEFEAYVDVPDPLERHLRAAAVVSHELAGRGLVPVVVGGSALEFYTRAAYQTADLDLMVPGLDEVASLLVRLGFQRHGASFVHPRLPLVIDLPPGPLAGDPERLTWVTVDGKPVAVISPEDLLIDRLNAWVHWHDESSREWGVQLIAAYRDELDWDYLRAAAAREEAERLPAALDELRSLADRLLDGAVPDDAG